MGADNEVDMTIDVVSPLFLIDKHEWKRMT